MDKPGKKYALRSMICAPKDHVLLQWDLSQAESWVVAFLADERNMKQSLMFSDIHADTAEVLFGDQFTAYVKGTNEYKTARYVGKRYNHASAYRMGYIRAAEVINKDSDKEPFVTVTLKESKRYSEAWHNHYQLQGWWNEIEERATQDRTLITPYRRIRVFFAGFGNELFKEMTANVPQSTVADHLNGREQKEHPVPGGLREVYKRFVNIPKPAFSIINQSHDSFMTITHKDNVDHVVQPVTDLLYRPIYLHGEKFTIPVDCEMGERWGELQKVKVELKEAA